MKSILNQIKDAKLKGERLLAVLIDPDKISLVEICEFVKKLNTSMTTHIFVGGSEVKHGETAIVVAEIKKYTHLPVVLFPGDNSQITEIADAILFLSLLSGRNPEYLIGQHVTAIPRLKNSGLEIISTSYILIDGNKKTSVERISKTQPIDKSKEDLIINTAIAGQYLGHQLIYLEAGSGAKNCINSATIFKVSSEVNIPVIVGGGIKNSMQIEEAYTAGATMVVIGTALEKDTAFFNNLKREKAMIKEN